MFILANSLLTNITVIAGYIASLLVFSTFYMKTMIPLRVTAICSNFAFITYGILGNLPPILILHSLMLPLNLFRLFQMKKLIKKVKDATHGDYSFDWLVPFMSKENFKSGEIIFKKGDLADKIYFIQGGTVIFPEIQKEVGQGTLLGEVGIFTPNNVRSVSAISGDNLNILSINSEKVLQLYFQNPKFGVYFMRAIADLVSHQDESTGGIYITFDDYAKGNDPDAEQDDAFPLM